MNVQPKLPEGSGEGGGVFHFLRGQPKEIAPESLHRNQICGHVPLNMGKNVAAVELEQKLLGSQTKRLRLQQGIFRR